MTCYPRSFALRGDKTKSQKLSESLWQNLSREIREKTQYAYSDSFPCTLYNVKMDCEYCIRGQRKDRTYEWCGETLPHIDMGSYK